MAGSASYMIYIKYKSYCPELEPFAAGIREQFILFSSTIVSRLGHSHQPRRRSEQDMFAEGCEQDHVH